jgi:hypothetical protein
MPLAHENINFSKLHLLKVLDLYVSLTDKEHNRLMGLYAKAHNSLH